MSCPTFCVDITAAASLVFPCGKAQEIKDVFHRKERKTFSKEYFFESIRMIYMVKNARKGPMIFFLREASDDCMLLKSSFAYNLKYSKTRLLQTVIFIIAISVVVLEVGQESTVLSVFSKTRQAGPDAASLLLHSNL